MGPLQTHAGWAVDLFLLLLVSLLPAMLLAVRFVRRGKVRAHARLMVGAFVCFLVALVAFEAEVRLAGGRAPPAGPFAVHLAFAVPALALWIAQIALGKRALLDPAPHRRRGRVLLALLSATVATGVWLYVVTFAT
jgi:uncharacterized membrane protein